MESTASIGMHFTMLHGIRRRKMVLCVGQGPWEHWTLDSTRAMAGILGSHNSGAWVDFWGYDVAHDWPWWRKQMPYFLSHVL